jgi:hypothetical protein
MIDGKMEFFQQLLGWLQAEDIGEAVLKRGVHVIAQPERGPVLLDKAGGIVGYGLIAGQGFVKGLGRAAVQRREIFNVQQFGNFFEIGFFRHGGPPQKELRGDMRA